MPALLPNIILPFLDINRPKNANLPKNVRECPSLPQLLWDDLSTLLDVSETIPRTSTPRKMGSKVRSNWF